MRPISVKCRTSVKSGDSLADSQDRTHASMQCVVLVAIAASDVVFAMDSIPAILSITTDPFLVVTSNCFAVMGLRSLFFVLAALQSMFKYLQQALAVSRAMRHVMLLPYAYALRQAEPLR